MINVLACVLRRRFLCTHSKPPACGEANATVGQMKYLNVAEKNDAAKTIAGHLSNGSAQRVDYMRTKRICSFV